MKKVIKVKAVKVEEKEILIDTDFIKLDSFLKLANIAMTGGHAKIMIQDGEIEVNGEICQQRGKKLHVGDKVRFEKTVFIIKEK